MTSITHDPGAVVVQAAGRPAALSRLLSTDGATAPLILRLALAAVLFPHGAQKLLGWFGGYGFDGTMGFMTSLGIPAGLALAAIATEFLAPVALLLGAGTRIAAAAVIGLMIGAVLTVHLPNGFFMNWSGAQAGEGFEYHLLVIGMALALLVSGAGRWSIDRTLRS